MTDHNETFYSIRKTNLNSSVEILVLNISAMMDIVDNLITKRNKSFFYGDTLSGCLDFINKYANYKLELLDEFIEKVQIDNTQRHHARSFGVSYC